ncbi:hypothetical protein [Fuerstiella marisgermanici]|uniref:Uncharacterized protein n=1 Tax=Fuerstiella marisgermanici TaxID=1891926 RepID=A0A1P8WG06_9PLAN|nr:hypothetical protein [Fuerstiella marisgermanici]APZ92984.1 hypothetical protein Fuma_02596 [Fuerstiella marisgermanici]
MSFSKQQTRPLIGSLITNPLCPSCGAELQTPFERSENICQRLACRGPWLQEQARLAEARAAAERRQLEDAVDQQLQRSCPDLLQHDPPLLTIIVPSYDGKMVAMSEERRLAFRAALTERFAAAEELVADPQRVAWLLGEHRPEDAEPAEPYIINACSTCRGNCCRAGREIALLHPEFLALRLLTEPDRTAAEMIEDYIDRIPDESLADSCVYHTPDGCQLPREIRSTTCNEFLCAGIRNQLDQLEDCPNRPTLAVATEAFDCVRVGVMESDGSRTERSLA